MLDIEDIKRTLANTNSLDIPINNNYVVSFNSGIIWIGIRVWKNGVNIRSTTYFKSAFDSRVKEFIYTTILKHMLRLDD